MCSVTSAALVKSLLLTVAPESGFNLRLPTSVSPVAAVREASSQLQPSGGKVVPSHP